MTQSLFIQVVEEICCFIELQKQLRKRGNPVILFKIRKDLVLIGAGCVRATTPSSMVSVHLPELHGRPLQSTSCFAACCCTWLRFAALLKSVCLFNSCKWNAQRGQCPSTHLLVSGLSRPQRQFCLIQTEAKQWDGCMDTFYDRQQFPPQPLKKKKTWSAINASKVSGPLKKKKESKGVVRFSPK